MIDAKITYATREVPPSDARALPYPLQAWSFVLERLDGAPVDDGFFECAGKKGVATQDHAWSTAMTYFGELGYRVAEVIAFAPAVPA